MTNWQTEYKERLVNGGLELIRQETEQHLHNIRTTDKRTHNGKMFCMFERAELLCCYEVIVGLGLEQHFGEKVHASEIANAKDRIVHWATIGYDYLGKKAA